MSDMLSKNMKLIAQDPLKGFGGVGEGMSLQVTSKGKRVLWIAHEGPQHPAHLHADEGVDAEVEAEHHQRGSEHDGRADRFREEQPRPAGAERDRQVAHRSRDAGLLLPQPVRQEPLARLADRGDRDEPQPLHRGWPHELRDHHDGAAQGRDDVKREHDRQR